MSSLVPIFSIESGHVIAALAKISGTSLPEIIFIHQEYFAFQNEVVGSRLEDSAIKSLEKSLKVMHKFIIEKKPGHVGAPAVILGAPWYHSETKTIKNENRTPVFVKESLIDALIAQETASSNTALGTEAGGTVLIDKKVGTLSLNGYPSAKPFGKKASTIEFSIFVSVMPVSLKEKIKETLRTTFPFKQILWETLGMVLYSGLSNLLPDKKEFLIVDVGAELSEISLVRNRSLEAIASFPFGTSSIVRSVGKGMHVTPQIAHSLLSLIQNPQLQEVLAQTELSWRALFTECLNSLSNEQILPPDIYLFTGNEYLPICNKFILGEEFMQSMIPGGHFNVIPANTLDLHTLVSAPLHARHASAFQLSTLFVSWLLSQKEM